MNKESLQVAIGKRIRQLRVSKGKTQENISDACGFENSNMSRLEQGGVNPTLYTLQKIADYLEVDIKEVVDFTTVDES